MAPRHATLCGIFALLFLAVSARSQSNPDVFGTTDEGITVVGWQDFFPATSDVGYTGGNEFERTTNGNLYAGLNMLPNGVLLTQASYYVRDDDPSENIIAYLCWSFVHSASGQALDSTCETALSTNGQPGETVLVRNYDPPLPILYGQDVDGDGNTDVVNYFLSFGPTYVDANVRLRMVRLRWKRQVSPAPGAATFNDVPTSHLFFRYVEALAAAGITGGCGGNNYCPDAPLTRGQMAVFLAKALGLHWPWNAAP
jgi:S-layer homology domain